MAARHVRVLETIRETRKRIAESSSLSSAFEDEFDDDAYDSDDRRGVSGFDEDQQYVEEDEDEYDDDDDV